MRFLTFVLVLFVSTVSYGNRFQKMIDFDKDFWDVKKRNEGPTKSKSSRTGKVRDVANVPVYNETENRAREDKCRSLRDKDFKAYQRCSAETRREQLDARERRIDAVQERQSQPLNNVPKEMLPGSYRIEKDN